MYSVLAHVTVQPQQVDEFITLQREHARDSLRDEPGTLGFDVIQDEKAANHFFCFNCHLMRCNKG
ncbi:MAG: antibiotic biosynthesis monooxygenase [Nitrospira sp.]|nr:antibiotic biosynthesis monooxygenase [Nitrospira sp.]